MSSSRAQIRTCAAIIILAGAAVYANSLTCPFVFDDQYTIVESPYVTRLWPLSSAISSPYQSSVAGRPVVAVSLAVSYAVNGLDPRVFRAFNIVIHIGAGLLLFGVIRRTLRLPGVYPPAAAHATWLALAATLLWIVHPLQTESVTYIIQRSESLAGLFYLAAFYCFIRYAESRAIAWGTLAVISCGLGMASKEIVITAPFVILVYDRIFIAGDWADLRRRLPIHAGLAATWIILYLLIRGGPRSDTAGFSMEGLTPWIYATTQFGVILHYLGLAIFPHTLNIDYCWQYVANPLDWVPHMLTIAVLLVLTVYALWRAPQLGFLAAAFFILLSPTSSFVPIADAAFEHRMYLPLAPLCILIVLAGFRLVQWLGRRAPDAGAGVRIVAIVLLVAASTALAARSIIRNRDYSSAYTLWQAVLRTNPTNPRAFVSLGNNLLAEGKLSEAKEMFQKAMEIDPGYVAGYYGMATALLREEAFDKALIYAEKADEIEQLYSEAKLLKGIVLTKVGRLEEAADCFRRVLAQNRDHAEANFNLACIHDKKGDDQAAEAHYLAALRYKPIYPEAFVQLADLYMRQSRPHDAIQWYLRHLDHAKPTVRELNRLATAFSQVNLLAEAVPYFQKALQLDPNQAAVRLNLGNTFMRMERREEAIAQYEHALRINPGLEPARQALARAQAAATSQDSP